MQQETLLQFLGGICQKHCYKTKRKTVIFFHALPVGNFILSVQQVPKEAGAKSITTRKILDNKFKFGRSLSS